MPLLGDRFYRTLYRSYYQGSSMGHFVYQRVTATAWLLMGLFGVSMVIGGNLIRSVVIILSALTVGFLVVGFFWVLFRKGVVEVNRILPEQGSVDEMLTYRVRVTNRGKTLLRDVALRESEDDQRPGEWQFMNLKEPGEEKRNIFDRTFVFYRWKWLMDQGGAWEIPADSEMLSLKPGETQELRLRLKPKRRWMITLHDLRLLLPEPFGLFQRCRKTIGKEQEILVVPRRYVLPPLDLAGQSELKLGGETASSVRGEGGEFLGLREYRAGDPMRRIHWRSWARTGTPVVKQHEENRFARYGLVLDTNLNGSRPDAFEECVSVAASFVSTLDRDRCLLDLMFIRDQPQVYTAGRGVARVGILMETLARVEASGEGGYESLEKLVRRYAADLSAAVIILSGWDEERRRFLARLRRSGLSVVVFAVVTPDQEISDANGVHFLRLGQIDKDLLTSGKMES